MDLNTGVPSDFAFTFGIPFTQEVLLFFIFLILFFNSFLNNSHGTDKTDVP